MQDIRQSKEYARYLSRIGWNVEKIDKVSVFVKKFPLIGSVLKIQRPGQNMDFQKIGKIAQKHRVFQIIIEPINETQSAECKANGFKLSKSPYLPTKTLQIDLKQRKEKIFTDFEKDCRSAIKKNNRLNIRKYELGDLNDFRNYWKGAVGIKRYVPPLQHLIELKKAFRKNSLFVTSEKSDSGAIFLNSGDVSYYWQAFTNKDGRKKLYQYKIVWEGILWSKKNKAKIFDFEGIYDKRFPNGSWLGFSHFKKSFGGKEISYPGCFVKTDFLGNNMSFRPPLPLC